MPILACSQKNASCPQVTQADSITQYWAGLFHVCGGLIITPTQSAPLWTLRCHIPAFLQLLAWGLDHRPWFHIFLFMEIELRVRFLNLTYGNLILKAQWKGAPVEYPICTRSWESPPSAHFILEQLFEAGTIHSCLHAGES